MYHVVICLSHFVPERTVCLKSETYTRGDLDFVSIIRAANPLYCMGAFQTLMNSAILYFKEESVIRL
jgi:hypothetical protein